MILDARLYMTRGGRPSQSLPGAASPVRKQSGRAAQQNERRAGAARARRRRREGHDAGPRRGCAGQPLVQRRAQHRLAGFRVMAATVDDQHRAKAVSARPQQESLDGAQRLLARLTVEIEACLGTVVAPSQCRAAARRSRRRRGRRPRRPRSRPRTARGRRVLRAPPVALADAAPEARWRPGHPARAALDAPGAAHRLLERPGVVVARRRRFGHRPPARACGRCRSPDG